MPAFQKLKFGRSGAHLVLDGHLTSRVLNCITAHDILQTAPFDATTHTGAVIYQHYPSCCAFLVTMLIKEKKMCFVVCGSEVYLLSVVVSDRDVFTKTSVFRGYLSADRHELILTDIPFFMGCSTAGMDVATRRMILYVFSCVWVTKRKSDALTITVSKPLDEFSILEALTGEIHCFVYDHDSPKINLQEIVPQL
jgi:hypothetical protein